MRSHAVSDIDRTMLRLRSLGLDYPAISAVLNEYHGWRIAPYNVRTRCRRLGAPPARQGRRADRAAAGSVEL